MPQVAQHRVGHRANTQLERRAVGDEIGDVLADLLGDRVGFALGKLLQWPLGLHASADARYMDEAIAKRARHARIDLGDHCLRQLRGRQRTPDLHAERAKAMLIRRPDLDQGNI